MPLSSKVRHGLLLGLIVLSACAPMSRVESPAPVMEADRPDFTESSETVAPGSIQAETGYTFSRDQGSTTHSFGELLVRVPAGSRAEVRVGFNSYSIGHAAGLVRRGFEDMEVGTKIRVIDHDERSLLPDVSILAVSTLPTGNRNIGSGVMQPTAKLAIEWHLNERLSLESNANYSYAADAGTRFSQWGTSASLGTEITPRLKSFVEWFGTNPASLGAKRTDYLNAGAGMKFGGSFILDARAGANARVGLRDYFVGLGMSRRW